MAKRAFIAFGILLTGLGVLMAPAQRTAATVGPPPTCTDPRPGGTTHIATGWLTAPGTLVGTIGPDVLVGTSGDDIIKGLGGDDLICGIGGNDTIEGGTGNDVVDAEDLPDPGRSQVRGGTGNDWIVVQGEGHGDAGNDYVLSEYGTAWGDAGNDNVRVNGGNAAYGGAGEDNVLAVLSKLGDGGSGSDFVHGAYAPTVLLGGSGNDILLGDLGDPVVSLNGGSGRDECTANGAPTSSCEVKH